MKMIVSRNEAVTLCSFFKATELDKKEFNEVVETVFAELDISEEVDEEKGRFVREYFQRELSNYTTTYLQTYLNRHLRIPVEVKGEDPVFFKCPVCAFKTLSAISEYCICKVCFWEDDGTNVDTKFSHPNKMTLGEAKVQFTKYHAIGIQEVRHLDDDRFLQYHK